MKKAALYARVSSDLQQKEGTIKSQVALLKRQIKDSEATLVRSYIDDGYSGARLDRPGLDRLRRDLKKHTFDVLFFLNADRIARDVTYQNIIIGEILGNQKQLIINGKDYVHNPENKFTLTVLGAVSELERAKLIERITRGRQYRLRQGYLLGNGFRTFGYTYHKKTATSFPSYTINEGEAKVIRYIFETYVEGEISVRALSKKLKERGVKMRNKLGPSQLKTILANEMYTGVRYFNTVREPRVPNPANTKRRKTPTDRSEWIGIPVPAIVSQELFAQAQTRRRKNFARYRKATTPQLLVRLLICGVCGSHIMANRKYYRVGERIYQRAVYRCRKTKGTCKNPQVDVRVLDTSVIAMIHETLVKKEELAKCLDIFTGRTKQKEERIRKRSLALKEEHELILEKRHRIVELYAAGDLDRETYVEKIREYDSERKGVESKQRELQAYLPLLHKKEALATCVEKYCAQVQRALAAVQTPEEKRAFVRTYVASVTYRHYKSHDTVKLYGSLPLEDKLAIPFCITKKVQREALLKEFRSKDKIQSIDDTTWILKDTYGKLLATTPS